MPICSVAGKLIKLPHESVIPSPRMYKSIQFTKVSIHVYEYN